MLMVSHLSIDWKQNKKLIIYPNYAEDKTEDYDSVRKKTPHFGSFYLRVGAISFGIGTMVYSGLEFGQYFEISGK